MKLEADFAITHQPEYSEGSYLWSGWKRRRWPASIIRPGLRLYGFDKKSRRFFALLEITRGSAFEYETKQQFASKVKRLIGANTHKHAEWMTRIPHAGIGFSIELIKLKDVDLPFRDKLFPRLGWYRFARRGADTALLDSADLYEEGAKHYRNHLVAERSAALRTMAKNYWRQKHGRLVCLVCRFDFAARYGSHGDDFIEMHHEVPLSGGIQRNSVETLVPLCSNCHRMIHRNPNEVLTTDDLRGILKRSRA